ncbi:MAG: hypothetical protein IKO55_14445 [Kiritimatiellae bacterium]|nr:hypothetical protein [Kiritimatiellia bacterium]
MNEYCRARFSILAATMVFAAVNTNAAEPIRWFNGVWDERGAPQGKLLTDNGGWWGERVWTGVTYGYEASLGSCGDYVGGNTNVFGRRLIDGRTGARQYVQVRSPQGKPIVAVFDFKRPCVFNEVDLVSSSSPKATASLSVSPDGTNWTVFAEASCSEALTRIRPEATGKGRYLRVSFHSADSKTTLLDEVLAWGEGEVSEEFPDDARSATCSWTFPQSIRGEKKTRYAETKFDEFAAGSKTGVEIVALDAYPDRIAAPVLGRTPEQYSLRMARNETEARYFAIVNTTRETNAVAIAVEGFDNGVAAESLIGGIIRTSENKRKLSKQEIFDLKIKGEVPDEMFEDRYGVLPFFGVESMPSGAILSRHVVNREQVRGFPSAVPLRPGECAVLMLRFKTDGAKPGIREGVFIAGKTRMPLSVEVVGLTLPDPPVWVYAWGTFTPQFPFESRTRFERDAQAVVDLGVSQWRMPEKGTKLEYAMRKRLGSWFMSLISDGQLFHAVYGHRVKSLTDAHRKHLSESVERALAKAAAMGIPPERVVFDLPDEIGPGNAKVAGEMAQHVKTNYPSVSVFCNPSFWMRTDFAGAAMMTNSLCPWYNDYVDVSVPYRSHLENKIKREEIFTKPRRVNAQYAHPAARAGRSIAWSSFRYGMNGYAWWCYYWPTGGTPWDIRTWSIYGYETKQVMPLENGVAVTPMYEEMREAWEDWRLLTALKEAGKTDLLDALIKEFGDSFDPPNMETARPYKCDFFKLRDRVLEAFKK